MLDDSYIVQTNQGSSGSGGVVTSFSMTLGAATTAGNAVIAAVTNADPNRIALSPDDNIWLPLLNVSNIAPVPAFSARAYETPGGETTFAWTVDGIGDIVCWVIMEVSGLATMDPALDTFGSSTGLPVGWDGNVSSAGIRNGAGTTCNTQNIGFANANGDDMVLGFAAVNVASGTPPAVSTIADTTAGQPGTWARNGSTVATSRAAGVNLRLDWWRKYTAGTLHLLDATVTWASSAPGACAGIAAVRAEYVPPQATPGRASTNSMV